MWRFLPALVLFPLSSLAAPANWEITTTDLPRAVYFDAGRGALLISLDDNQGHAHLDQFGLDGKLQKTNLVEAKGEAGALRTYGDKIFWLVQDKLVDEHGKSLPTPISAQDVTVNRAGNPVLAGVNGVTDAPDLKSASGIYQKNGAIFVLYKQDQLLEVGKRASRSICGGGCRWLELDSHGDWITVQGLSIYRAGKKFLDLPTKPGRPAYVFRLEPKDDFIALPFPEEKKIRTYSAAAGH